MTPDDAKKRIAAIEKLQSGFVDRVARLDTNLLIALLEAADGLLASPKELGKLLAKFERQHYLPALQGFGVDLLAVKSLNVGYFESVVGEVVGTTRINQALFDEVTKAADAAFTERFGITAAGKLLPDGPMDLLLRDTSVRQQLSGFLYGQRASKVGITAFRKNLKALLAPAGSGKGLYSRTLETTVYDAYQQADRMAQQVFSEGIGLNYYLYLGGTIVGTRPFCRIRDGQVFSRAEIDSWGTARDKDGGYVNKATGYFSGKPTVYVPFLHCGGYGCRHHLSAISEREAIRRRPELGDS